MFTRFSKKEERGVVQRCPEDERWRSDQPDECQSDNCQKQHTLVLQLTYRPCRLFLGKHSEHRRPWRQAVCEPSKCELRTSKRRQAALATRTNFKAHGWIRWFVRLQATQCSPSSRPRVGELLLQGIEVATSYAVQVADVTQGVEIGQPNRVQFSRPEREFFRRRCQSLKFLTNNMLLSVRHINYDVKVDADPQERLEGDRLTRVPGSCASTSRLDERQRIIEVDAPRHDMAFHTDADLVDEVLNCGVEYAMHTPLLLGDHATHSECCTQQGGR